MSVAFSDALIKEYQAEMYSTYGVLVNDADAQVQLRTLVRSMFTTVIAEQRTESRELGQGMASATLAPARFLSHLEADGGGSRGSITPTSRHQDNP